MPPFPEQNGIAELQIASHTFVWINKGQKRKNIGLHSFYQEKANNYLAYNWHREWKYLADIRLMQSYCLFTICFSSS